MRLRHNEADFGERAEHAVRFFARRLLDKLEHEGAEGVRERQPDGICERVKFIQKL